MNDYLSYLYCKYITRIIVALINLGYWFPWENKLEANIPEFSSIEGQVRWLESVGDNSIGSIFITDQEEQNPLV